MPKETLLFWVLIAPLTFVLDSLGEFVLFRELANMDHFPKFKEIARLIRKRWVALVLLLIAIIYLF